VEVINNVKIIKQDVPEIVINPPVREINRKGKETQRHLKFIEQHIDENSLMAFRDAEMIGKWYGDVKDESLFMFWLKLRRIANNES